jgi:hypothetical protein
MQNAAFSKSSLKSDLIGVIRFCRTLERSIESKSSSKESKLAGINLFQTSSFRLNVSEDNNAFIGLSIIKSAIGRSRTTPTAAIPWGTSDAIIISSSSCDHNNVQKYIGNMASRADLTYVIKDQLSFKGEFSIMEWAYWIVFAINQAIRSAFSKQRRNIALTVIEVLEVAVLLKKIKLHRIVSIYDFVPFEVDSNFLYLCTRAYDVHTTKVPSPGPLSAHNAIVLSDALVLSSGYHFDELPLLAENFIVTEFLTWPPERAHTYYNLYTRGDLNIGIQKLGFYSHGEWVRKKLGLVKKASTVAAAEEQTLRMLGRFLNENPEYSLVIYPHPKERKNVGADDLIAYYADIIGSSAFTIAAADKGTTFRFQETDIAVTCYSTIIFERLYCGFKTIIKRIPEHAFPKSNSPLTAICFETYDELAALIGASAQMSSTAFFEQHHLTKYLHNHFPNPLRS